MGAVGGLVRGPEVGVPGAIGGGVEGGGFGGRLGGVSRRGARGGSGGAGFGVLGLEILSERGLEGSDWVFLGGGCGGVCIPRRGGGAEEPAHGDLGLELELVGSRRWQQGVKDSAMTRDHYLMNREKLFPCSMHLVDLYMTGTLLPRASYLLYNVKSQSNRFLQSGMNDNMLYPLCIYVVYISSGMRVAWTELP